MTQRKIVLIGKTGDGKSSTGNTILGKEAFISEASPNSVTNKCESADGMVDERQITVIDTPGFFDTKRKDEEIKSEIVNALIECAPCIDAFLLVLKVGRYTRHEDEVFQQFLNTLTEDALKHTVILFTFGEQLKRQSIKEFVNGNPELRELVDKCGGRCHVFDNEYWNNCHSGDKSNSVQVKKLMETIDKMVEENGSYSNELLQTVERKIKEVMTINGGNQEEAKIIVHEKIMKHVVGAATGALVGALLGVGVVFALVVVMLKSFYPLKELLKSKVDTLVGEKGAAVVDGAVSGAVVGRAVTGGAAAAAEAGGAVAGGAGVSAGTIAVGALGAAAAVGAVTGGITGWKAAEDADSVCDAMKKAATANYEKAKAVVKEMEELVLLANKNMNSF